MCRQELDLSSKHSSCIWGSVSKRKLSRGGLTHRQVSRRVAVRRRALAIAIHSLAALAAVQIAAPVAQAQLYWDSNGTTAGAGATPTGTWGTSAFWNTDATGGAAGAFSTATANTDNLFFVAGPGAASGNNAYTVTVNGAVVANGLTFQASGATTLSGGTSITLGNGTAGSGGITLNQFAFGSTAQGAATISTAVTLNNSQTWTNNAAATLTTGSIAAGTNTLTYAGTGNFALNASSAFTGTTAGINFTGSGLLDFRNLTAPTTTGTWTISGGGRLLQNGNLGTAQNIAISGGYVESFFNTNFTRALGTAANQIQFTGGVSGISENGDGSTVNFGNAGATISWGTATFNPTQFILGASTMQSNNIRNTFLTLANGIDLNGSARTIRQDQADGVATGTAQRVAPGSTITGNIIGTGGGSLIKEGVGRLTISGTNTYTGGTTINNGTVRFTNLVSMPGTGAVAVNNGTTIGIGVGGAGQWTTGTSGVGTVGGLLTGVGGQGTSTVSYSGTVGVELINATDQTYSGNIANVGATLNLIKSGAGVLGLGGANTYTGTTRVFAGTLRFGTPASLYNGNTASWTAANLNVQTGATLALSVGGTGEFALADFSTLLTNLASASSLTNGMNAGAAIGIDTSNAPAPLTYSSVIANTTGTNGGARGFTKLGSGTLTLSGTNTYTGTTTIAGGTLIASGGTAIANTSLVSLGTAAGTTFQLNDNETIGNLAGGGTTGGTVALQGNTLSVGDATAQTYAGNFTGTSGSSIVKQGSAALTLSTATNIPGTLTINAGSVLMGSTTVITGGTITLNANNAAFTASGIANAGVSGAGGVVISNPVVLGSSVTTTGARLFATGNGGKWNFTGGITGAANTTQTLFLDSRGGGTTGGDRTSTVISGVIADGGGTGVLNLNIAITPQTSSSSANNHPTYVNLTGANTFTGSITATRGTAGATSWLVIGGERWSDGGNNAPTYGRQGTGRLGDNNGGVYAGAINLGSTAGQIVNLSYFSSANQTWSGVIGGGSNPHGALVKEGTGTLTLTNANLYNSLTTIGGGTLVLGFGTTTNNILPSTTPLNMGLGTSYRSDSVVANLAMTIAGGGSGGTLRLGGAAATGTQTVASLTTAANTTSGIVVDANRTLTITSGTVTIGTNSALNFNTAAGGNDGATVGSSVVAFSAVPTAFPASFTVTDATGFGLATVNGSNQVIRSTSTALLPASGAAAPTDYRVDNNSGGASAPGSSSLAVTASQSARSITVDTTAGSGTLTLNSGVVLSNNVWNFGAVSGTNSYTVTGNAGGAGVRPVASGDTVSINNFNGGTVTFNAPILANGANALVVGSAGTVVLAGVNTFTGSTTINGGNLQIGGSGSLASGNYAGAISISAGSTFQFSSSAAQTLSGAISGPGSLTKDTGTGTLILSGANTYNGATTITAGTLQLGSGGTTGSLIGTASILNNGNLTINRSNAFTQATDLGGQPITGSGSFTQAGTAASTTTLSVANSYTGSTTISSGILILGHPSALGGVSPGVNGTSGIVMQNGSTLRTSLTNGAMVVYAPITTAGSVTINTPSTANGGQSFNEFVLNGAIGGTGNVSFVNTNNTNQIFTVTLNTPATYTGTTTIDNSAGTSGQTFVKLGVNDALPTTTVLNITGQAGTGTGRGIGLNLSGFNQTLAGLTNTAFTLRVQEIVNSDAVAFSTLTINGSTSTTFSGNLGRNSAGFSVNGTAIPGSTNGNNFGLTKNGTGTFTVSGNNTFIGATKILGGILSLGSANAMSQSPLDTLNSVAGDATNGLRTTVTTLTMGGLTGNKDLASVFTTTTGGYSGVTALTLNATAPSASYSFSGGIADGAANMTLNKTGTGTQVLAGANTYTGATTVTAGILRVDGPSGSITSPVTVNGGRFGGSGTTSQPVTVSSAGTIAPGNGTVPGTFTVSAANTALTFASGATFDFETAASPDRINLTGTTSTVAFGSVLNLNITGFSGFDPTGQTFTLVDYTGADPTLPTTINFIGDFQGDVSIDSVNSQVIISNVTAVPEPASAAFVVAAGIGLLAGRRRRRM